jgi:hypothetical protein
MSKSIMLDVRECCLSTVSPLTHHTAGDTGTGPKSGNCLRDLKTTYASNSQTFSRALRRE